MTEHAADLHGLIEALNAWRRAGRVGGSESPSA